MEKIKLFYTAVCTALAYIFGGMDKMLAILLDQLISIDSMALSTVAVSYYIANEGFSILENWGAMGLPLPTALKSALAKLRKEDDEQ